MPGVTDFLSVFCDLTKSPEEFLSHGNLTDRLKCLLKNIYDFTKNIDSCNQTALPELIVDGFDEEQIWQELEINNKESFECFLTNVARMLVEKNRLLFPVRLKQDKNSVKNTGKDGVNKLKTKKAPKSTLQKIDFEPVYSDSESDASQNQLDESEDSNDEDQISEDSGLENHLEIEGEDLLSEGDDGNYDSDQSEEVIRNNPSESEENKAAFKHSENIKLDIKKENGPISNPNQALESSEEESSRLKTEMEAKEVECIEDQFFKLSEMDDFLTKCEETPDVVDQTNIDYFFDEEAISRLDESDNLNPKYSDFFTEESVDNGAWNENESDEELRFDGESDSVSEEYDHVISKSQFEIREEKMKGKIAQLEAEALEEKPWQLKGEVNATSRPINSLLEEVVEFDVTQRPAPIMTEQTTLKLEDIINQRIRDRAYDDVERKIKLVDTPHEFKQKLVLNQEKSKVSLAEIYEQEYIKQRDAKNPEVQDSEKKPDYQEEIEKMMNSLFKKLDALSNFHYTPKPAAPDFKIVTNVAVVNMEEVAPIATADATLLAPEEVAGKAKYHLLGKGEKTSTDKKRERRKKKTAMAKKMKKQNERLLSFNNVDGATKKNKEIAELSSKKLTQAQNISMLPTLNHTATKTSSQFFTQLNDMKQIPKIEKRKHKAFNSQASAKKFKL